MDLLVGSLILRPYVFAFLVAFVMVGARDLGLRRTLLFGGIVWPIAWLAEFASTHTGIPFGLYHYTAETRGREIFIANVPFFDSLSFTFLAYAALCLARRVLAGRSAPLGTTPLLTGFLMMMLDVVIDPAAVRGDRWFLGRIFYYVEPGAYFGVPLSNFAGWWLVGAVGVVAFAACGGLRGVRAHDRLGAGIALYYAVLGFNLAVTGWIGEWRMLGVGLAVHAVLAYVLAVIARPAPAAGVLETGGMQRA